MKKVWIVLAILVLVLIALFLSAYLIATAPMNTGEFSLDEFAWEIENFAFQGDQTYGEIDGWREAAKIGKNVIAEHYEAYSEGSLLEWMGCSVKYDAQNDVYYVRTFHLTPFMMGGAYDVILRADGTVVALWGEK
ncbi:MAG: hypothetical protein J6S28_03830 [Clostridia bacterium]|nr:hypothetical protein [Clostridia bacterium]